MLYYLLYNQYKIPTEEKIIKILGYGTILYILLYSLTNTKKYIVPIAIVDCLITVNLHNNSNKIKKSTNTDKLIDYNVEKLNKIQFDTDTEYDIELKHKLIENNKKIKENNVKIKNYKDMITNTPQKDIDKDYYINKIKQQVHKNEKRFNSTTNLNLMEQNHVSNNSIQELEIEKLIHNNNKMDNEKINKAISNYSTVENMPQDMTDKILNQENDDSIILCHLPITDSDLH